MIRLGNHLRAVPGFHRFAYAAGAGAFAALALPPLNLWPVLFAAFPVFLVLLEGCSGRRPAFALGWALGLGYFLVAFHWIGFAFLVDAKTYLWMMPFAVGGLAAAMAIYWGIASLVAHLLRLRGLALALGFAALLAGAEWLRGHLFTGFPWAAPGLAADGMGAVAQAVAVIGMPGLTLLIVLWAGLGVVLLRPPDAWQRTAAAILLLLLPVIWAGGHYRLSGNRGEMVAGVAVRIVQPNIAQDEKWRAENSRTIFNTLKDLSREPAQTHPEGRAGLAFVLWPESAVPFLIDESDVAKSELRPILGGHTTLITGSIRRDKTASGGDVKIYNSIIAFDGSATPVARYDKWRLVPGGEFLPFEGLLEPLGFRKVVTVPGSFAPGPGPRSVALPGGLKAAMLICYEAIFPHGLVDPADRPDLIVNVTNDGWFGASAGPYQHLAQARLRAIEQGLPLLRAANTGISAIVDAYGVERGRLAIMTRGVLDGRLPSALQVTVYGRFGDWSLALLEVLTLALSLAAARSGPLKPKANSNH